MSWKKAFKTAEEAVEYLFWEELESEMIALPPEVDEFTDEEGFDDTETLDPSVRDVAGSIEISVPYENHDHRETDLLNKSKKRSCLESGSNTRKKGKKELIANWKKVPPNYNFSDESNASKINYETAKWGIFDKHLSIDEMMIRYYGHHYFKQYIKGKPIRFGYKMWALCGNNGYCYNFDLYSSKEVVDASSTVVLSKSPSELEL
ncbi:uncharacterized protein TNIN_157531 [Trichonephila inaurata madagascariensis]|uniref:PiggyBac transposable element-derived protein domain-containing protein n=1 Tax=Trichonephila inaurata madagascariensis TaxID=2747483 RepID=A0A8X6YR95_9ARAC|nr:uncharacterized protein TNIN_157531 [Trichonephila inaurata madagascariensis]